MKITGRLWLAIFLFICSNSSSFAHIRIVLTTALTENFFEVRKTQYLESFRILSSLGYQFYIIEGFKREGPTFLDDYSNNVFYASTQNLSLPSHQNGINEAKTFLEGLKHFNFDPEDMIIKITGRYHLLSDYFLKLVENNQNADAILKNSARFLTLGFAMKCKHIIEMYENIDYTTMERKAIDLETEATNYIERKKRHGNFTIIHAEKLDIRANLYGTSTWQPFNSPEYIDKYFIF